MQAERLTIKAQAALQAAQRIAHEHANQEVDGEHLFAALLQQEDGLIQPLLQNWEWRCRNCPPTSSKPSGSASRCKA